VKTLASIGAAFAVATTSAASQELPPLSPDIVDVAAVACVKIGTDGVVTGAFL